MSSLLVATKAELYKTRHHRLPYVVSAIGALAAAAPGVYFMFRPESDTTVHTEAALGVATLYLILAGAIFGGWMLGHEYRQQTIGRAVATTPARQRLFAAKGIAGMIVFALMAVAVTGTGLGAGAIAAAMDGNSLSTAGLGRELAANAVPIIMTMVVAFGASAAFRSDTYATLSALALLLVFSPLLFLIPNVGPYTIGALSDSISSWIGPDSITPPKGAAATLFAAGAWLVTTVGAGAALFGRRDL